MEIPLSNTESEYISLSQSMRDLLPTKELIVELLPQFGIKLENVKTYSTVFEYNQGVIALANAPKLTPRTKHIGIKYHFFCEHVRNSNVQIQYVETGKQIADVLTKGLTAMKFQCLRKMLMGW